MRKNLNYLLIYLERHAIIYLDSEVKKMLINFSFTNHLSFRDRTELSLRAQKITEYSDQLFTVGTEKVLPMAVVYGANASGKSNIYRAFMFMSFYVIDSFKFGDDDKKQDRKSGMKAQPFLFDENSKNNPTNFEVTFNLPEDTSNKIYQYNFTILKDQVIAESLSYRTKSSKIYKTLFLRDIQNIVFNGNLKKWEENIKLSLEPEVLIVSLGAKLKIPQLKSIRDWFFANNIAAFGDPGEAYFRSHLLPTGFVEDSTTRESVLNFIHSFDKSITGFNVEEIPGDNDDGESRYKIDALHGDYSIPLSQESNGTLKMFSLYDDLKEALHNGCILFVDELDEKLHPLIVRNLMNTFLNKTSNPKGAQLLFTTHDVWQLSNESLRRDEIYFVSKDQYGVSTMTSLADIRDEEGNKIRKDESFEKNYLNGKYKAVPSIEPIKI